MHYSDYVIYELELTEFEKEGNGKLSKIWTDILSRLPKELRKEAKEKGFRYRERHEAGSRFDRVLYLYIPGASYALAEKWNQLYTDVICLRE
jgi:hypothetical protein